MRFFSPLGTILGLGIVTFIIGCAPAPRYTSDDLPSRESSSSSRNIPPPTERVTPISVRPGQVFTGVASFYGSDFHGKLTANGEVFDMYGLTAAHRTLPLNTVVRVTNLANNESLIVRINDRGPYIQGRILDLSYGAALKLGFVAEGTTRVRFVVIEVGDDEYMEHLPR